MHKYIVELPHKHEARFSISFGPYGSRVDGIVFDDNANVVAETGIPPMYVDYCHAEMIALTIGQMIPALADDATEYVSAAGIDCECDDY